MDLDAARENMIECQLRTNKITDNRILSAMGTIPRERFVPPGREEFAYTDVDIPCADGRFLMAPMAVARLIQEAEIKAEDRHDRAQDLGGGEQAEAGSLSLDRIRDQRVSERQGRGEGRSECKGDMGKL